MKKVNILVVIGILMLGAYFYNLQKTAERQANNVAIQSELARKNNTYLRTVSCILSVPLATRTPEYIDNCYTRAEKVTHQDVDRFGADIKE